MFPYGGLTRFPRSAFKRKPAQPLPHGCTRGNVSGELFFLHSKQPVWMPDYRALVRVELELKPLLINTQHDLVSAQKRRRPWRIEIAVNRGS